MASVLLVEDDASTRELVTRVLTAAGHRVTPVNNGAEAVTTLTTYRPDVIVLDLVMPGVNGLQLLETIHKRDDWRGISVIVTTGSPTDVDILERFGVGAVLRKPFERAQLIEAVEALARRPHES